MNQITGQLSNREIALLIWMGILFIASLLLRPAREAVGPLLKLLLLSKLGIGLLALLIYEAVVVFIFYSAHIWQWWMLKDTLFWLFGSAIIAFLNAANAIEKEHYFRKVTLDSFRFAVILAFVVNLYVFNLITELILVPVLTVLAVLGVVAGAHSEFKPVKKLIDWIMVGVAVLFVVYAIVGIATDFHGFATLKNLEDFLTPVVLTLTLLPMAYLLGLYSAYESLFSHIDIRIGTEKQLASFLKRQIVSVCRFRLSRVSRYMKDFVHRVGPSDTREDVAEVIRDFRAELAAQERGSAHVEQGQ